MTQTSPEPLRLWLKMVPNDNPNADGVWTTQLLPQHHVVARAFEPSVFERARCPETGEIGFWDAIEERVFS